MLKKVLSWRDGEGDVREERREGSVVAVKKQITLMRHGWKEDETDNG